MSWLSACGCELLLCEDGSSDDSGFNWIDDEHWNLSFVRDDLLLVRLPENAHEGFFVQVHDADQIRFD